jgi:hypothetical protein
VQGIDYAYTLQGWLKGINGDALNPATEMGGDGNAASIYSRVSRDVYAFKLGYFSNDYKPIGGVNAPALDQYSYTAPTSLDATGNQLFNGNISYTTLALSKFDSSSGATLINSLLVRSPDKTVTRVDAFINPPAFSSKDEYIALTDSIFSTIQKGNRRISLTPKEETYRIFGTESSFNFKLPAGYFVTVDEKYDFGVFKIKKFKNSLTDTVYSAITIYAGHHPSYIHKEYGYTEEKANKTKGSFLQSPVEWIHVNDKTQSFFLKEKFIPADMVQKDLVFHVAMLTNKKESLDELTKIIESVKLVK